MSVLGKAALVDLLAPYVAKKNIARFAEAEQASGQCKLAAFNLATWLKKQGQEATVLNLSEPKGFEFDKLARFWQDGMYAFAIHYSVRVGELSVDLTARQFDPGAPFPQILTLDELRQSWRSAYDVSLPLSAGALWSDN